MKRPIILGLAGGSCSGKASISNIIAQKINTPSVAVLHEKGYYKNKNEEPTLELKEQNFDHPSVFNNKLLLNQIKALITGKSVHEPYYSFRTHQQLTRHLVVKKPSKVIIIEGLLVLYDERLRKLMNIKAFVDADADIRVIRRLRRDIKTQHRTLDESLNHYVKTVRPMYQQFVAPTKRYADIIIPESWRNKVAINLLITRINGLLEEE